MRKLKLFFIFVFMFYSFHFLSATRECAPGCVILENQEDSGIVGSVGDEIMWPEIIRQAKDAGKIILIPASGDTDSIPSSLKENVVAVLKRKDEAGKPSLFIMVLRPFFSCV